MLPRGTNLASPRLKGGINYGMSPTNYRVNDILPAFPSDILAHLGVKYKTGGGATISLGDTR
jgi:hypothetical protein